ncbi:uncharacterized protein BJ171DRAFT_507655 [Polychytrium aggregatum]|uniref:uncharacterized protein n=1 Tax=Polychytrium aggregatum TaxID=110093 RepID=UPI0022FF411E|nr:uncharacterized protein BJ171DRAFT_507655 [Polychytrium aggregatum]KAI9204111.1 hypothetical protein BJ171DRAFT_507655 [Polychytrium aggregatum]
MINGFAPASVAGCRRDGVLPFPLELFSPVHIDAMRFPGGRAPAAPRSSVGVATPADSPSRRAIKSAQAYSSTIDLSPTTPAQPSPKKTFDPSLVKGPPFFCSLCKKTLATSSSWSAHLTSEQHTSAERANAERTVASNSEALQFLTGSSQKSATIAPASSPRIEFPPEYAARMKQLEKIQASNPSMAATVLWATCYELFKNGFDLVLVSECLVKIIPVLEDLDQSPEPSSPTASKPTGGAASLTKAQVCETLFLARLALARIARFASASKELEKASTQFYMDALARFGLPYTKLDTLAINAQDLGTTFEQHIAPALASGSTKLVQKFEMVATEAAEYCSLTGRIELAASLYRWVLCSKLEGSQSRDAQDAFDALAKLHLSGESKWLAADVLLEAAEYDKQLKRDVRGDQAGCRAMRLLGEAILVSLECDDPIRGLRIEKLICDTSSSNRPADVQFLMDISAAIRQRDHRRLESERLLEEWSEIIGDGSSCALVPELWPRVSNMITTAAW